MADRFSQQSPRIDHASRPDMQETPRVTKGERLKNYALGKTPQKLKNPTDLQIRLRTGVVYTLATVICLLAGNIPTVLMLSATAGICAGEFFYMLRSDAKLSNELLGIIAAVLYPPATYWFGLTGLAAVSFCLMAALLIWYVFWMHARISDVCTSLFGAMYMGVLLSCAIPMRTSLEAPWGGVLLVVIYFSIWFNDGAAYLVGSRIGKHKLAPRISPKKSWEGFIAGVLVSMLFWFIIRFIPGVTMSVPQSLLFGAVCGVMAVIGDLVESRIKRNLGFKDSGTIMPGHGGLFDRCDSTFLVLVTALVLLKVGGCIAGL